MKKKMMKTGLFLTAVMVTAFSTVGCAQKGKKDKSSEEVTYETKLDTVSYAMGVNIAENFQQSGLSDINLDAMKQGFVDVLKNDTSWLASEDAVKMIQSFMQQKEMEKAEKVKAEGVAFLEENKGKEGVKVLPSGIQYEVISEGTGVKPTLQDTVKVHYEGTLIDGSVFDSSIRRGMPATFPLSGVIQGWQLGLQEMAEGAKYKLYIPSDLAYGPRGTRGIPGNSVLIFEVELIEVVSK